MKRIAVLLSTCFLLTITGAGLMAQNETLAVCGGKLYTITKGVIEDGVLLIHNGRILALGKNVTVPDHAKIIDASGLTIMPGYS